MKLGVLVLALVAILTTNLAGATIEGSTYEERHQEIIEKTIYEKCGIVGQIFQLGTEQENIIIDNGITDIAYKTTLKVKSRIDQNYFEEFFFVVKSLFTDAYDHQTKNWGVYSVESILALDHNCQ